MSTNTKKENNSFLNYIKSTNLTQTLVLIAAVVGAYFIGSLSAEVRMLKNGAAPTLPTQVANNNQPAAAQPEPDLDSPREIDHIRGNTNARVALIEYSDYDCPFCATFHETAIQAIEELDIMWIYRHLPLDMHPEAYGKAIAAECVALQGGTEKFWEFSDILFRDAPVLADLSEIVGSELNLNAEEFQNCLDNELTADKVDGDLSSAGRAQANGTPGNFLLDLETGGVLPLRGAVPFETIATAVESL